MNGVGSESVGNGADFAPGPLPLPYPSYSKKKTSNNRTTNPISSVSVVEAVVHPVVNTNDQAFESLGMETNTPQISNFGGAMIKDPVAEAPPSTPIHNSHGSGESNRQPQPYQTPPSIVNETIAMSSSLIQSLPLQEYPIPYGSGLESYHVNDTIETPQSCKTVTIEDSEPEDDPFTIGEKLEYFYLCLIEKERKHFPQDCEVAQSLGDPNEEQVLDFDKSIANSELYYLAQAILLIEDHQPLHTRKCDEPDDVVQEIVKDVRRKAAQYIRVPYIETINTLITSCRKRLKTKTSLGTTTDTTGVPSSSSGNTTTNAAIEHGQRYLLILMDLLGTWSNIIQDLLQYRFSKDMLQYTLGTLYQRVMEMTYDCYRIFETDKDLPSYCRKCLDINNHYDINLNSLDNILGQLSKMKSILISHYQYLFYTFSTQYYYIFYMTIIQEYDHSGSNNCQGNVKLVSCLPRIELDIV